MEFQFVPKHDEGDDQMGNQDDVVLTATCQTTLSVRGKSGTAVSGGRTMGNTLLIKPLLFRDNTLDTETPMENPEVLRYRLVRHYGQRACYRFGEFDVAYVEGPTISIVHWDYDDVPQSDSELLVSDIRSFASQTTLECFERKSVTVRAIDETPSSDGSNPRLASVEIV